MAKSGKEVEIARRIFHDIFKTILGEAGVRVLEYHFRRLSSSDPYELLLKDTKSFYEVLHNFFRSGTDAFLKITASTLLSRYMIGVYDVEDVVAMLSGRCENAEEKLRELLDKLLHHSRKIKSLRSLEGSRRVVREALPTDFRASSGILDRHSRVRRSSRQRIKEGFNHFDRTRSGGLL